MKKFLLLLTVIILAGCTYGQDYLENPESFIRDPHFADYKKKRDDLEHAYLHKEITYAEYIDQKGRLDNIYAKEVQKRNDVIMSPE